MLKVWSRRRSWSFAADAAPSSTGYRGAGAGHSGAGAPGRRRALYALTRQFDGADLEATGLRVTEAEYREAEAAVTDEFRAALQVAVDNITAFHRPQVPASWFMTRPDGRIMGQQVTAVDRAGVYVPGGSAPLFSCLLMTAIPAVVAGVREVIVCTPPDRSGRSTRTCWWPPGPRA